MKNRYLTPAILLLGVAIIQFFTMPSLFYPGDNFSSRIEASHWLETGHLTMPFEMKKQMPGFFGQRGQYFYEDDEREVFSSKYAIGCTLAYVIPTLAERLHSGSADPMAPSDTMLLFINLWQILLTIGLAIYCYLAMGLYTSRQWLRTILILLAFYTTFVWHYLRAPTFEIFQLMPFVASFYHMACYLRSREHENHDAPRWGHLAAAISYSCILVWLKPFFVLNCIILAYYAMTAGNRKVSLSQRIRCNFKDHYKPFIVCFIIPAILFAVVLLAANTCKFGSPFNVGYKQWMQDGLPHNRFSLSFFKPAITGFFLKKGNANIFIHYPLLVPALLGIPLFWKRYGREKGLLAMLVATNLLVLCFFKTWSGAWCYGPRYLIHLAILLTLPLIPLMEWLIQKRNLWLKLGAAAVFVPVLAWSLTMQVYVNSLPYFTFYQTKATFNNFNHEHIDAHFKSYIHRGQLNADLIAHRYKKEVFPPLEILGREIAPQYRHILKQLDMFLQQQARWNYYFADEKP